MKHTVELGDTLYSIAQKYNINVDTLMKLNHLNSATIRLGQILEINTKIQPRTNKHIVKAGESLYQIAKKYNLTVGRLKQMNRLASYNLRIGQELLITEAKNTIETPPLFESNLDCIHVVQAGDTLYNISQIYNIKVNDLLKVNNLTSASLKVGQKLKITKKTSENKEDKNNLQNSQNQAEFYIVDKGDTLYAIAQKHGLSVSKLVAINNLKSPLLSIGQRLFLVQKESNTAFIGPPESTNNNIHIVQKGESLYAIARKYGLSVSELSNINKLNSDKLSVGQKLIVVSTKKNNNISEFPAYISYDIESNTLPNQIKQYIEDRKTFNLEVQNGLDILAEGIKSAVGRNRVNKPDDLKKIQDCLVQLQILNYNHGEEPNDINSRPITANLIPKTIAAIELLQQKYKVKFWIEHSNRIKMMQTNQFTWGVVQPNDITFKFLKEFTEYKISFSHPHNHQNLAIEFHNFTRSSFTRNYQGVSYVGYSKPDIPIDVFRRLGVNDSIAQALQFVSKHEGNFDAINSYDKAIFSWGFIQFAGNGGGFAPLMANIKNKAPKVFQEFFQKFGIDVEYETQQKQIRNAQLVVANPYDKGGKYISKGTEAEQVISADKQLYGVFMRAGYYLPIVTLQIDAAIQNYVKPALNIHLSLRIGVIQVNNAPITDFIKSAMGLALAIDLTINQWINKARAYFRAGIEEVAKDLQLRTRSQLYNIDERLIIKKIIEIAKRERDSRANYRATSILNSGLSFRK